MKRQTQHKTTQQFITPDTLKRYQDYLYALERSQATIAKYLRDVRALHRFLQGGELSKEALIAWKHHLTQRYATASVNSMLAAVNSFISFLGRPELSVRPLKIQKKLFCEESRELTKEEYLRLVAAARERGNQRLSLILQTICATGIRVSELSFITADALRSGQARVTCKGKQRIVFLPKQLCRLLREFMRERNIRSGPVFATRSGKPVDRSNIWREMKSLCESAGVDPAKVFPHNLRHLFARTYYAIEKDLSRLADILGHSSVDTTKIYMMESGRIHARQLSRLGLIFVP